MGVLNRSNTGPCHAYGKLGRCTISRMHLDGTGLETYAKGVRNSVGACLGPSV